MTEKIYLLQWYFKTYYDLNQHCTKMNKIYNIQSKRSVSQTISTDHKYQIQCPTPHYIQLRTQMIYSLGYL